MSSNHEALWAWIQEKQVNTILSSSGISIEYKNEQEGNIIIATRDLHAHERTLSIPLSLSMNIISAKKSICLQTLLEKEPMFFKDFPQEILALHLMTERRMGQTSSWAAFLACLPSTYDTPLFWTNAQLEELHGTNVYRLSNMMMTQMKQDYETVHLPFLEKYKDSLCPGSLPVCTFEDYMWACSTIWSRAFGVTTEEGYMHVLCPILDMFNHNVLIKEPLDSFISYTNQVSPLKNFLET